MDKASRIFSSPVHLSCPDTAIASIPDKLYFKIGEVKKITGVEPHVLRYWESEFKNIRPMRAAGRQRMYRRVDVENILEIKKLLYEDGYTVPGARKYLAENKDVKQVPVATVSPAENSPESIQNFFRKMRSELLQLKKILEDEGS